jgi:hypothetical protein
VRSIATADGPLIASYGTDTGDDPWAALVDTVLDA